jgi:hypothetical protein
VRAGDAYEHFPQSRRFSGRKACAYYILRAGRTLVRTLRSAGERMRSLADLCFVPLPNRSARQHNRYPDGAASSEGAPEAATSVGRADFEK